MSWLDGSIEHLRVPEHFVVLAPGCAPHRPYKRWPAERFAELAARLTAQKVGVTVIGTEQDREGIRTILRLAPAVMDFSCRTDFGQLAALGRRANAVVGNDTGPVHILAAVGAPTLVLISGKSHPFVTLPESPNVRRIQIESLADLSVDAVERAMLRKPQ
jgi:ADP-heptose:LPS heptosyltransferase